MCYIPAPESKSNPWEQTQEETLSTARCVSGLNKTNKEDGNTIETNKYRPIKISHLVTHLQKVTHLLKWHIYKILKEFVIVCGISSDSKVKYN